jgi:Swiss Army Knife protein, DSP-PTPase phosphatase domain
VDDSLIPGAYWVVPGKLAAGPYPGRPERLSLLAAAGVDLFLDLTQAGEYDLPAYEPPNGAEHRRIGVPDFGVPSVEGMRTILDTIDGALDDGRTVYVHCYGGIGRTGTAVGCLLVRRGLTAEQALARIADWRSGLANGSRTSPETGTQRRFVADWAANDAAAGAPIGRGELVERLAEVSHSTWLRQKVRDQGSDPFTLGRAVTDHDRERAEDAVRELERLGIWPPGEPA